MGTGPFFVSIFCDLKPNQPEGISFEWRPIQEQAREIVDGDYLRQQQEEDERGVTAATWVLSGDKNLIGGLGEFAMVPVICGSDVRLGRWKFLGVWN